MIDIITYDTGLIQIVIDDVSGGDGTEYRATLYDNDGDVINDAWGKTERTALANLFFPRTEETDNA
jgi:hypothetical protein